MAQVTVQTNDGTQMLSEQVLPVHIDDAHYSVNFLERFAWAVHDASEHEAKRAARRRRILETPRPEPQRRLESV